MILWNYPNKLESFFLYVWLLNQLVLSFINIFQQNWKCLLFFTFFYINRRKHWFRANLWFPVFGRFMFWDVLNTTISGKCLSFRLCVCDRNLVASVTRELMHRISQNLELSYYKLVSINFWKKSLDWWRCNHTFPEFSE